MSPFFNRFYLAAFYRLPMKSRIGIVAAVLLGGALITYVASEIHVPHAKPVAAFLRMGMVLGAIWLAWDNLVAIPKIFWTMLPVILLIAALRPYYLFIVVPMLYLLMLFWPVKRRKPGPPPR